MFGAKKDKDVKTGSTKMAKNMEAAMHQDKCWFYGFVVLWAASTPAVMSHEQSIQPPGQGLYVRK
jgi:hypothetical protein